ncbi:MAG TPA: hypothetical protein P5081_02700 [Phycisphaerae bacterium]|nr:hypothetical protein [Phycisphaerae bacterium]HRW51767.1 hypothetical protein [Phycisphaerae bacterium]
MTRVLLILWLSVHTLAPTVRPLDGAADRKSDRCCCCASAATCKCGCERPSTTDETESGSTFSACACNDAPAVIPPRASRDEPVRCVAIINADSSATHGGADAIAVHPHLRGPPPDLRIVQSTILLV